MSGSSEVVDGGPLIDSTPDDDALCCVLSQGLRCVSKDGGGLEDSECGEDAAVSTSSSEESAN